MKDFSMMLKNMSMHHDYTMYNDNYCHVNLKKKGQMLEKSQSKVGKTKRQSWSTWTYE